MRRLMLLVVVLLCLAGPAFAHVEVSPETAARGSAATLTFSVPNEDASAATVKVEVFIPAEVDVAAVTVPDTPSAAGWSAVVGTDRVTWSGGKLTGDQKKDFAIHIDPLPSAVASDLVFKALQTYDNGEVVRWIDLPTGGEEPPHPAPVVRLTGAVASTTSTTAAQDTPPASASRRDKGSNQGAIAAIIVAALVVVGLLVVFATRGRRRGA